MGQESLAMLPGTQGPPQDYFRLLVESIKEYAICTLDCSGKVTSWNIGAEKVFGYTAKEILGRNFALLIPRDEAENQKDKYELSIALSEGIFQEEGWRVRKDQTLFWATITITLLRKEDGEISGFGYVIRDLTSRRHAEELLREGQRRYRRVLESLRDYVAFLLDQEGRILTWNKEAERITGYSTSDVLGFPMAVLYSEEDRNSGKPDRDIRATIDTGHFSDEGWKRKRDGSPVWTSLTITQIFDETGAFRGYSVLMRDLSERKHLEEQLNEALQIRDDFISIASHELKNPITSLALLLHAARKTLRENLPAKLQELIEAAEGQSKRLTEMIDNLLDVSRARAGTLDINPTEIDLSGLVHDVIDRMEAAAKERKSELRREIDENVTGIFDRVRIDQVITNLISNSLKYAPGSPIDVRLSSKPGQIRARLEIEDHGPGIPPDARESIFEKFHRLPEAKSQKGLGLGLYVVRQIVQAHSGSIWVESAPGKGARFIIDLPLRASTESSEPPPRMAG